MSHSLCHLILTLCNRLNQFKSISNHFWFIQPFFQNIQLFLSIRTHIQLFPVCSTVFGFFWIYPTNSFDPFNSQFIQPFFPRYPTVWIESNPYPTVSSSSNQLSEISYRLDRLKSISNRFRFI